LPNNKVVVFLT